jgi:hypothetical protein
MNDGLTLRAYRLTDLEATTIYKALDIVIPLLVERRRNTDEEIHSLIALRERFHIEQEEQA